MIGNITSGKGARGLLNYITEKDKAERIGGTMAGENSRELSREMAAIRNMNPDAANPIKHFSLSLPPGERLSSEQWENVAHRYMDEMGYGNCQWVAYRHSDTEKDHIHIAASRTNLDGKLIHEGHERAKSQVVLRSIEREYGLKIIASSREKNDLKQPTRGETRERERTGKESTRRQLQGDLRNEARGCKSLDEYRSNLEKKGIQTSITFDRSGQPKDILYSRGDFKVRGERLGPSLTLKGLDRAGVSATGQSFERDKKDWEAYRSRAEVRPRSNKSKARDLNFIKMRVQVASHYVASLGAQIKEITELKAKADAGIRVRQEALKQRSESLRTELKTARVKGKDYRAAFRSINQERQQLRRELAEVRINAGGDKLLLMRERYYAELRATSERFSAKGELGSKSHQDALAKVDFRYTKAFDREASIQDRAFKSKLGHFQKTGNVTWFSDKGKTRTERINGAFAATKEAIKGIVTGKNWKETIKATQEKWAECSINARFANDRTRGDAIRDLWKLDLSRAQQERAAAISDLSKKGVDSRTAPKAETLAKDAKEAPARVLEVKAAKLPEMSKEKVEAMRSLIAEAANGSRSFEAFKARLAECGIGVEVNRRGEHVSGLVYVKDGEKAKASSVGHGMKQLEEKGVDCGSVRAGGRAEVRHDSETGRREDGGRPGAGEGEAIRADAREPEPSRTRDGSEAPRLGTDLGAGRIEPATPARDHQRLWEGQGRVADRIEDAGRRLEGRDAATAGSRTPEPGRGPEPQRAPDAGRPANQPWGQSSCDAGRASVVPHPVHEVSPSRAAAEQRCTAFIQDQVEKIRALEGQRAELQSRLDAAKGQDGRELKPGELRVSIQERADMREGVSKLDTQIYQEKSRGQEASMMRAEGRAEQWSQGRDLEQKAQAIREGAKNLPLGERSAKMAESRQLETAAFTAKHGPDQFHGKAKDLGAAQWKAGRLMDGVDRLAKEGHIKKDQAAHIKEGFGGGWSGKQLVEAVKALEGAGIHRERPPEKASQDMLKTALDAIQKCCGKGFDIDRGLSKGNDLSLGR